jgi:hypothetical protein
MDTFVTTLLVIIIGLGSFRIGQTLITIHTPEAGPCQDVPAHTHMMEDHVHGGLTDDNAWDTLPDSFKYGKDQYGY